MFRCPNCARIHKIRISENYSLMSNENSDVFHLIKEPFFKDNDILKAFASMRKVKDIYEAAEYLMKIGEHPVNDYKCDSCQETHDLKTWMDAYENPMDYFDAEQLCHCGEELWMDRIPYTNRYGLICEKCGWVKPKVVVSGSADATVQ